MQTDSKANVHRPVIRQFLGFAGLPVPTPNSAGVDNHRQASLAPATPSPSVAEGVEVPTRCALDPDQFAAELLAWLQGPNGRTGSLTDAELREVMNEMCAVFDIEPQSWIAVSRQLRKLLGDRKRYVIRNGRQTRVFHIPPLERRMRVARAAA